MDRRLLLGSLLAAWPLCARAAGGGGEDKAKRTTYLPLKTLVGVTLRGNGRRGVLSVECGLDVPDSALRSRADASLPRLRAAFAQVVQTYAAGLPSGAPPNVDFIARNLQQQADGILGRPGAKVLLGAVLVN
jgi:hypothetical protein